MSDPVRWRASEGAPAGARELLQHAKAPTALDAAARARHAAAVAKIAAGAAAPGAVGAKAALVAKLLGVGLAATVAVAGLPAMRRRLERDRTPGVASAHRAPDPAPAPAEAPVVMVPAAPSTLSEPVASPAPTTAPPMGTAARHPLAPEASLHREPVAVAPPTATPIDDPASDPAPDPSPVAAGAPTGGGGGLAAVAEEPLLRETRLIRDANAALGNDPREALARLDAHAREFPDGQFAADREFVAVQALRSLGRADEARARGEALIARFPRCPYVSRTQRLLDALP